MTKNNLFQMWRVVVALAHTDHNVTAQEREFIISKFDYIAFSEEQKRQLTEELDTKTIEPFGLFMDLNKMERAECLHMIHTLFTNDGEYHPKEQTAYNRLKEMHMNSLDVQAVKKDFNGFLDEQYERRKMDDIVMANIRDQYDLLSNMERGFSQVHDNDGSRSNSHFAIWRVIIALAHADNIIDYSEKDMIINRISALGLTKKQLNILFEDMETPKDAVRLFEKIDSERDQAECLYLAHKLLGVDDEISPEEEIMYQHLKSKYAKNKLS